MRSFLRSPLLRIAALAALTLSCTDSPTGPVPIAPEGTITLSDSVFTRGAVVRARVDLPTGFALIPGSVTWTVVSGSATITAVGGGTDSVDVAFTGSGAAQLRANYTVRSLGLGSSLTIASPTRRPAADVAVTTSRALTIADARLDYTTLPAASATAGATLGNIQVAITDARGRIITTATDSIVLALDPTSGTTGATLLGTLRARPTAGVASFSGLNIRRAGVGYRVIASSPSLTARDTATTTIIAGAPNAAQSTLTVADTLRTVGQTTTVTIVVRDEFGNPVLTATPSAFTPSASAGTLGTFTCTNGTCTATYTAPDVPGAPTIGATIGGAQITGGPQTITVSAGPAAKLVITGDTLKVAGTTTQLTITALDARGNVASSYTGSKNLTFSGASLAPIGTAPTVATKAVGDTAAITFASGVASPVVKTLLKAETARLAATDGVIAAANADRLAVRVVAAEPSATQSTMVVADSVRAGGQTTIVTVTLKDAFGNPVTDGTAASFTVTPSAGTLSDFTCENGVCTATYTPPVTPTTYTLTGSAGGSTIGGAAVPVRVSDTTAPVITGPSGSAGAATSAKSVPENTTAVHTFTANETVTWSLDGGADVAKFAINATTGALTFLVAPDFENPSDVGLDNVYVVTVKAVDAAGNVSAQTLSVTVTDVDDTAPSITGPSGTAGAATDAKSVAENTTAVHTFTANETVTWSLDGGADAAKFAINATTGALTFLAAPDFELPTDADGDNIYVVTVKAVDADGNPSTQTLSVTVTNVDDTAPSITGPSGTAGAATGTKSVAENTTAVHTFTANETVTWSLDGGADVAKFAINATTGALTFLAAPDFESPSDDGLNNTYVVIVKATDGANLSSTQTLTVTVTDVPEGAPAITGPSGGSGSATSAVSILEGTTAVHTFSTNKSGVTWSLNGGDDAARFTINASTGAMTFSVAPVFATPTDANTDNQYIVVVRATDLVGSSDQTVTVTVLQAGALQLTASAQSAVAIDEVTERIVFTVNSGGTRTAVTSTTTFSLSSTGGGTFYSDAAGTTAVTTATVAAAADSFVVYYKQTTGSGTTTTLTATRASGDVVSAASVNLNVTALASAASRLAGIICSATTGNSNSSTLTADGACNATAGQLLIMVFSHSPTANPYDMPAFATPTGWTKLREERIGTAGQPRQLRTYIFYKIATTTGNQAVTFSTGAGGGAPKVRMTYIISAINNPASGVPIDTDAVSSTMTPTSGITVPSATATANGSMQFAYAVQDIGSNAFVAPAGLATVGVAGQGGQAVTMIIFSKDRVFAGASPSYRVGTAQVDAASIGGSIIIKPQ